MQQQKKNVFKLIITINLNYYVKKYIHISELIFDLVVVCDIIIYIFYPPTVLYQLGIPPIYLFSRQLVPTCNV